MVQKWVKHTHNNSHIRNLTFLLILFQDCPAALNFANEDEANRFKCAVEEKLRQRQQRKIGNTDFLYTNIFYHIHANVKSAIIDFYWKLVKQKFNIIPFCSLQNERGQLDHLKVQLHHTEPQAQVHIIFTFVMLLSLSSSHKIQQFRSPVLSWSKACSFRSKTYPTF